MSAERRVILPVVDDIDTGGYWSAAADGRLVVRACLECGGHLHLPKAYCHHCGSWNTDWKQIAGLSTVYSWTVVRHQLTTAFEVPYTMVLVELDEAPGARLLGFVDGVPRVHAGQALQVRFDDQAAGTTLVQWEPAEGWEYEEPREIAS